METLTLIALLAIAFYLGWRANEIHTKFMIRSLLDDMGITPDQKQQLIEHCAEEIKKMGGDEEGEEVSITLEQHQGIIFAYSEDDGTFMAQGKDRAELFSNLQARFSGLRCVVKKENGADLIRG